jgi:beta-glucanase (GH16 family)
MYNNVFAQLPFGDSAWVPQSQSDEFNGTVIDWTKWNTNYWGSAQIANGAEINYDSNVVVDSGYLSIFADTLAPNVTKAWGNFPDYGYGTSGQPLTYAYQSGVIQNKYLFFKYGYYEISAKFPSKNYSLWPAFWLYSNDCTPGADYAGELDIAENGAITTYKGNELTGWYHVSEITCNYDSSACLHGGGSITVLPSGDSLSGDFHKFACQWDPDKFIYYFDDIPIIKMYDTSGHNIPQHNMTLIIALGIDPYKAYLPANWNNPIFVNSPDRFIPNPNPRNWPQKLELAYFHYYKLETDCGTNATLCSSGDYDRKVKKSITTNSGCTPTFNPTTPAGSYTLRATDYILINEGITISPSGSGSFTIETIDCPQ